MGGCLKMSTINEAIDEAANLCPEGVVLITIGNGEVTARATNGAIATVQTTANTNYIPEGFLPDSNRELSETEKDFIREMLPGACNQKQTDCEVTDVNFVGNFMIVDLEVNGKHAGVFRMDLTTGAMTADCESLNAHAHSTDDGKVVLEKTSNERVNDA